MQTSSLALFIQPWNIKHFIWLKAWWTSLWVAGQLHYKQLHGFVQLALNIYRDHRLQQKLKLTTSPKLYENKDNVHFLDYSYVRMLCQLWVCKQEIGKHWMYISVEANSV